MELYAVLAELDGTGAPMAYLFVEKNNSFGTSSPGSMTQVIYQFLRVLDNLGVNPSFVDCGKDKSEIKELESSRTMSHTWTPRKFSSPMYYERYG